MSRSDFSRAMQAFESATAETERNVAKKFLVNLFNDQGQVRFTRIQAFHDYATGQYPFVLVDNQPERDRPKGRQLFYQYGQIQVRVKTDGTVRRPQPHMVVTLAVGQSWPDEIGKLTRTGELIPKTGPVPRLAKSNDWRTLARIGPSVEEINETDDDWAESAHFDFAPGFDGTGADALEPKK